VIKVVVADGHDLMRRAIVAILCRQPEIEVAGEAPNLPTMLAQVGELQPQVIIVNNRVPPVKGSQAVRLLRKAGYNEAILVVSIWNEVEPIIQCLEAGADGFIHKERLAEILAPAVLAVATGGFFLGPRVRELLGEEPYRRFSGLAKEARRHLWAEL
jgi:two-component system nitrate/nitrite response regulator NarL